MFNFEEIKAVIDDRMFIKFEPDKKEEEVKTAGGIILAGTAAAKMSKLPFRIARVIKAGPGLIDMMGKLIPTTVKVNDRVIVEAMGGYFKFKIGDDEYAILNEKQIIAVVSENFKAEANKELKDRAVDPMDLSMS